MESPSCTDRYGPAYHNFQSPAASRLPFALAHHPAVPRIYKKLSASALQDCNLQKEHPQRLFLPLLHRTRRKVMRHNFRSEEHTSELQSRENLVCRLLLEKKKKKNI